ncbi:MAG: methyltransferase domain-containing protein [Desulfovibrio sp.]|nr:methyltransferase domain-containing protein [Desulfovibrio sp.]
MKEKYDIVEHFGYIEENDIPTLTEKKFDCIVLAQVMEHFIYNPARTFKKIRNMILDNGYIYCYPKST